MIFTESIERYIQQHELLRHGGFYLVALSGGPDSVALLCALHQLGYHIDAVHCNFRLRGAESDRDEQFCVDLCQRLQIPLHRTHFDTDTYAALHQVSVEMAARELRYRYFEQLRHDIQAEGICVAHHEDDQVETVLLNLVRGTGITGLQGMKPRNGYVLRPMLCVSRRQVTDFLTTLGQAYVVDHTNLETDFQRNKLRLQVIPLLEELNPAARANILRMTENLGESAMLVDDALRHIVEQAALGPKVYSWPTLLASVTPRYALWSLLAEYGFNRTQVDEMAHLATQPAHWESPGYVALVDHDRLMIIDRACWDFTPRPLYLPEAGVYVVRQATMHTLADRKLRLSLVRRDNSFVIDKSGAVANLDAHLIKFPLLLRSLQPGDRFTPYGMKGSKLVSDELNSRKCSVFERRQQQVLTDAEGRIVWLVGHRVAAFAAITGQTEEVLKVELE